jgi:hypothetical protein
MSLQNHFGLLGLALVLAAPAAAHGTTHPFGIELRLPAALADLRPVLFAQAVTPPDASAPASPDGEAAPRPRPAASELDATPTQGGSTEPAASPEAAAASPAASAGESDGKEGESGEKNNEDTPAAKQPSKSGQAGSLDFDLLGTAAPQAQIDGDRLRLRRTMLSAHQGMGLVLVGLQLATTVVGQLNYNDKFGGANTGKYQKTHAILAYSDVGLFLSTGLVAMLAPKAAQEREGFDRITLHKVAMFTAATGMASEAVLGIVTASREGYQNQKSIGTAHLVIGYVTLAAIITGVSAIVF